MMENTLKKPEAVNKNPIHLLTLGYVIALVIIGLMSVCIHVVIGEVVREQNNSTIVISARQSKLSQRIALYANQYVNYKDEIFREHLADSIRLMEKSHQTLVEGNEAILVPEKLSPALADIYFELPYNLDERVNEFIAAAQTIVETPREELNADMASYKYVLQTAKGPLMNALDAALMAYEAESEQRIAKLQSYQRMALFVIFATLLAEAVLIFKPLVTRVYNYAECLKQMALTDALTGVNNSRNFMNKALKEIQRSKRHEKPLCVLMLDIDHFKRINDKYGHKAGDEVLQAFAALVKDSMRLEDEFARLGGEEFAALLPDTNLAGAQVLADRIRAKIEQSPIAISVINEEVFVTISIGVAEIDPANYDIEFAIREADKALYKAKEDGRNKVVMSESYNSEGKVVALNKGVRT